MSIDTTIYIKGVAVARLDRCSNLYNISRSKLVCLLIFRFMRENKPSCSLFSGVKYQAPDDSACWETMHLYFPGQVYELCLDVRKFFKLSVSLLISLAIKLYLDIIERELLSEQEGKPITDNYLENYICRLTLYQNITNYSIFWVKTAEEEGERSKKT